MCTEFYDCNRYTTDDIYVNCRMIPPALEEQPACNCFFYGTEPNTQCDATGQCQCRQPSDTTLAGKQCVSKMLILWPCKQAAVVWSQE